MDRERLIAHLKGEQERQIGIRVIDAAELAWKLNRPQITDFYDPYEQKVAKSVLSAIAEVGVMAFGGYNRAERSRLVIYPQFFLTEAIRSPIRVLQARGNLNFVEVKHGNYLGALVGLGLKREKLGDIICLADGCQVVAAAEVADYILQHWRYVHQVPVEVWEIDPEQMAVEPERVREIKATVASMRLDAVAAAGFGTSRTKIVREIKNERVKVNWKPITNPAHEIHLGDVLSVRSRGRVVVEQITSTTKKGRVGLVLKRMI
ncbi:MAG: photosystem II S4 domain protein [Firmicutes bacterium]|nr:YlmH/Sll1252 family protein [Bacillota bacterium]NLL88839.1 photosystem II S4 domain protein [Bacillota bacterium]HKM17091.1 YlmH/Sll1252 family protein [Limnochordia bacterium]